MYDHVPMKMVGQIKLLPTAWMGTDFGPALPVHQVHMILYNIHHKHLLKSLFNLQPEADRALIMLPTVQYELREILHLSVVLDYYFNMTDFLNMSYIMSQVVYQK